MNNFYILEMSGSLKLLNDFLNSYEYSYIILRLIL